MRRDVQQLSQYDLARESAEIVPHILYGVLAMTNDMISTSRVLEFNTIPIEIPIEAKDIPIVPTGNQVGEPRLFFYYFNCEGNGDVVARLPVSESTKGGCVIMASACQIGEGPFLGNASIQVKNVVPDNGSVVIKVGVAWHERLRFRVSVLGYTWAASA